MNLATSPPQVTVAISLFNYGNYIERALMSVCEQTIASEIELFVVDDASTDDSVNIVRRFQLDNPSLIQRLAAFRCELRAKSWSSRGP